MGSTKELLQLIISEFSKVSGYKDTLESALDCKDIKPVHSKGNQPWILIGKSVAETEAPILWPSDTKSQLTGKDPDAGKDWRQKEKRAAEDEIVR